VVEAALKCESCNASQSKGLGIMSSKPQAALVCAMQTRKVDMPLRRSDHKFSSQDLIKTA